MTLNRKSPSTTTSSTAPTTTTPVADTSTSTTAVGATSTEAWGTWTLILDSIQTSAPGAEEQAQEVVMGVAGQNKEEYTLSNYISQLEHEMELAARNLQFEKAALIRDKIKEIQNVPK